MIECVIFANSCLSLLEHKICKDNYCVILVKPLYLHIKYE